MGARLVLDASLDIVDGGDLRAGVGHEPAALVGNVRLELARKPLDTILCAFARAVDEAKGVLFIDRQEHIAARLVQPGTQALLASAAVLADW